MEATPKCLEIEKSSPAMVRLKSGEPTTRTPVPRTAKAGRGQPWKPSWSASLAITVGAHMRLPIKCLTPAASSKLGTGSQSPLRAMIETVGA